MSIKVKRMVALDDSRLALETEEGEVLVMTNIQLVAGSFENMQAKPDEMSVNIKVSSVNKGTSELIELYKSKLELIKKELKGDNDESIGY